MYVFVSTQPLTSSSRRMLSEAYLRSFLPISACPASWHVSVPLVFFLVFSYPFSPNDACPCLFWSSEVKHVSLLFTHFSHTFPHVVPSPPPYFTKFLCCICIFLVYRFSFRFLGSSAAPFPAVPVVTTYSRVASIGVGDMFLLVEDVRYQVQETSPSDGTVVLYSINTHESPFKRFLSQLWVLPSSTHDVVSDVDLRLLIVCVPSLSPRLLPDTLDSTIQMDLLLNDRFLLGGPPATGI